MRYAIIQSGGKQYKAIEGKTIEVDRLSTDVGKKIDLKDILLVADGDNVMVGAPVISDAKVAATVIGQIKGPKVTIFKYHPRKRYRLKKGHRQQYTRLMIDSVQAKGLPKSAPVKEAAEKAPEAKAKQESSAPVKKAAAKGEEKAETAAKKEAPAKKKETTKESAPSTRKKLSGFDISEKSVELLEGADVSTVSQLLKKLEEGDASILEIKGLGPKALEDIKKSLKKEGYSLP